MCGGVPTINAKNFSSLAFLLGHKRSLCPLYARCVFCFVGMIFKYALGKGLSFWCSVQNIKTFRNRYGLLEKNFC